MIMPQLKEVLFFNDKLENVLFLRHKLLNLELLNYSKSIQDLNKKKVKYLS